ncbi:MAG: hypothetical protein ACKN9T_16270 [Candidatus Methylumidiphilus sp.]
MDHDQAFKNLILDYPAAALEFFGNIRDLAGATITPVREEQLQAALGSHYRRLDVPLKVEWPDGRQAAILFVVEEETEPKNFSIHRLAHYCLDLSEMLKTTRLVPIVVFLRPGHFPRELLLGDGERVYVSCQFIHCELAHLSAEQYLGSDNIVARLNLPNMRHPRERRLDIYDSAINGLYGLEQDHNKRLKYADFIDAYANLSEGELARYRAEYLTETGEHTMGLSAILREEGRQEGWQKGRQEGWQKGRQEGKQEGVQEGWQKGVQGGEAALLLRLMDRRFGPFDPALRERILAADAETLLQWGERILTAATADEVVQD